ncbi:phage holin family protein [Frankia sp. Ag45/Mut15]|uniref:Phage holin family protein n=1 Tax=Frankia umida TaxID=573489 RepID=A0ABT0JZT9_9ACTN|nr:phage holin family protein [Frankia umida]MCK9876985.1 phage holin family protein [Frankia umida]
MTTTTRQSTDSTGLPTPATTAGPASVTPVAPAGPATPGSPATPYPGDTRGSAAQRPGAAPLTGGGAPDGQRTSTGHLVSDVVTDISTLFRQEVALAKAEVREEAKKAGKGAGMFAGAGGAGLYALLFALLAVMFGLGEVMALGWAALIVAAVLGAVTAVLALKGRSTVRTVHPAPTQTVETLREDVQWAQSRRH